MDACFVCGAADHDHSVFPCWWVAHRRRHPDCGCAYCHYYGPLPEEGDRA